MLSNYNPTPFWFLNHRLEEPEILRQLQLMRECGVSGFFIHPRAGLLTPYGSDEWFAKVRFIVEVAARFNLKAWLYDEDPFPSGAAGGRILMENPEFAARRIIVTVIKRDGKGRFFADLGPHRLISATAVKTAPDGSVLEERDVYGSVGVIRGKWFASAWNSSYFAGMFGKIEYPHYRAETFNPQLRLENTLPEGDWTIYCTVAAIIANDGKYGLSQDNLNPDCVRRFIELTHEKYAETLGEYFGSTIPGIFTDEPSCGDSPPWTPSLPEEFFKDHGYRLEPKLYHLFADFGEESRDLREHYWRTVARLYKTNFFGQISQWCREHNLLLCGHICGEENPMAQTVSGGSAFGYQNFFDIPGFDHITPNIGSHQYPALNFGGRFIASAAKYHGHQLVLSECFGCNAFNFGFDGMRKVADWLFALGINFLVPHGFYYSYDGWRKNDAGKSFFFQDPEFSKFKEFCDYAGNVCSFLVKGEIPADVCLINPARMFRRLMPREADAATVLLDNLYRANQILLEKHFTFVIMDDDLFFDNPALAKDFKAVVVPDGYALELPVQTSEVNIQTLKAAGVVPLAIVAIASGATPEDLISIVKKDGNNQFAYLFNNSAQAGYFRLEQACSIYDGIKNVSYKLTNGEFCIAGFTGGLLQMGNLDAALPAYSMPVDVPARVFEFDTNPEWDYQPPCNVIHSLTYWRVTAGTKVIDRQKFCLMRDMIGTELPHLIEKQVRPIFDAAPKLSSVYPLNVEFSTEFSLSPEDFDKDLLLVFENDTFSGDCRLFINNQELTKDEIQRTLVYDAWNLVAGVKPLCVAGSNTIRIAWKHAGEFDGLRSSIYIKTE